MSKKEKEALIDIQNNFLETEKKLQLARASFNKAANDKKRAELTLKELEELPTTIPTYKVVGKLFIESNNDYVRRELKVTIKVRESEVEHAAKSIKYLETEIDRLQREFASLSKGIK